LQGTEGNDRIAFVTSNELNISFPFYQGKREEHRVREEHNERILQGTEGNDIALQEEK